MSRVVDEIVIDPCLSTPSLVVDLDIISRQYKSFQNSLPGVEIFYAVKANPALPVIQRLREQASSFDAASIEEIKICLAAGVNPSRISFGNTVKKSVAIRQAHALGITLFAFDSIGELEKLADAAPGARVYCRLLVGNDGAEWPLSRKFGCEPQMAVDLMQSARAKGMEAWGLSFHVGSQQLRPQAWDSAIERAANVAARLREKGITIKSLNIGGGYPVEYSEPVPGITDFACAIRNSIKAHFKEHAPCVMAEPGRFLVAESGTLVSEVVLISRKSDTEDVRWTYLDIGRFGGLAETEGEAIRYQIHTLRDGGQDGPVIIAGPTCDSMDTLYQKSGYRLPLDLQTGDRVTLLATGAYTTSYASQGFNGFLPPGQIFMASKT